MIKRKSVSRKVLVCVEANCDVCKKPVRLECDSDLNGIQQINADINDVTGRHFVHNFGYGTEHDCKILDLTLCDLCIFDMFSKIGRITES